MFPEKSFCIPRKIFVTQNKHHLRGTLYPKKAFYTTKKVAALDNHEKKLLAETSVIQARSSEDSKDPNVAQAHESAR